MDVELGGAALLLVFLLFIALPIVNSIVCYRLGKKAGYNQAKMENVENLYKTQK